MQTFLDSWTQDIRKKHTECMYYMLNLYFCDPNTLLENVTQNVLQVRYSLTKLCTFYSVNGSLHWTTFWFLQENYFLYTNFLPYSKSKNGNATPKLRNKSCIYWFLITLIPIHFVHLQVNYLHSEMIQGCWKSLKTDCWVVWGHMEGWKMATRRSCDNTWRKRNFCNVCVSPEHCWSHM